MRRMRKPGTGRAIFAERLVDHNESRVVARTYYEVRIDADDMLWRKVGSFAVSVVRKLNDRRKH